MLVLLVQGSPVQEQGCGEITGTRMFGNTPFWAGQLQRGILWQCGWAIMSAEPSQRQRGRQKRETMEILRRGPQRAWGMRTLFWEHGKRNKTGAEVQGDKEFTTFSGSVLDTPSVRGMAGHQVELSSKKLALNVWNSGVRCLGWSQGWVWVWSPGNGSRAEEVQAGQACSGCCSIPLLSPAPGEKPPTPPPRTSLLSFYYVSVWSGSEPNLSIPGACSVQKEAEKCLSGKVWPCLPLSGSQASAAPSTEAKYTHPTALFCISS